MKATAIRVVVNELSKIERADPPIVILTTTIKFTLAGNFTSIEEQGKTSLYQEEKIANMLLQALRNVKLD